MDNPALQALLHNWFYGNYLIRELAAVVFALLFGSIPITPVFHWVFDDLEPRIARTATALAPVVNAGKGFLAAGIAAHGGGADIGLLAGVAAIAGHCYCPWRRFQGGTGTAVMLGILIGVSPPAAAMYLGAWLVAAIASNYAMVGALLASAVSVVSLWYFTGAPGAFAGVAMLVLVGGRYREAAARLVEDREPTLRKPAPVSVPRTVKVYVPVRPSVVVMDGQPV